MTEKQYEIDKPYIPKKNINVKLINKRIYQKMKEKGKIPMEESFNNFIEETENFIDANINELSFPGTKDIKTGKKLEKAGKGMKQQFRKGSFEREFGKGFEQAGKKMKTVGRVKRYGTIGVGVGAAGAGIAAIASGSKKRKERKLSMAAMED